MVRNGDAPLECARWLEQAATTLKDRINVVVRLHPNEDGTLYEKSRNLVITKKTPTLDQTLAGCDGLGALCSTVMLEGLLYHKPVLQFHPLGAPMLTDNWKKGLARRIASSNELEAVLKGIADGVNFVSESKEASARAFANHSVATYAVCDWIESVI